ncbi:MAG TPA: transporter substrate-binding domain-containing protein [Roseiarcus sp.]|nr:transporter substrate-binding domain-containing protein [Roseiarcus sp.]
MSIGHKFFYIDMVNIGVRAIIFCATLVVLLPFPSGRILAGATDAVAIPSFSDPGLRLDRPNLTGLRAIRFLTSDDYPPLDFALENGALTGFNVEIARAVCEELQIACTIQARRWDTLIDSLKAGKGDAVVASIAATAENRARIDFSQPYYQTPARFVVRKDALAFDASAAGLRGKTVGVIGGSSHEAYIKAFFPGAKPKPYPDVAALEKALGAGEIGVAFADGLTLSVWLNGELSANCCSFFGGHYCESLYFGEGVGIAVRTDDTELRRALNWALARLVSKGIYSELYLKYFPIGFY